ncbi:uncharacterized protein LTR77_007599 [Saxophila tyrrhenica]|uniref:N-acetyltransferase domain-containing protein n=1 Tax=Saxophila tyrrhenica TaxID=1690608 RepID=A0AAV9P5B2_9PEZI|nr:hypothetical protein LTR77_007599 [Saxophila tyrrhenica]
MDPGPQSPAFIRQYDPAKDYQAVIHVFRETCDETLKVEPIWTVGSYIWCWPYLLLNPESCFVVDGGNGTPAGYVIGVPNTGAFCQRWRDNYVPRVQAELDSLASVQQHGNGEKTKSIINRRDDMLNLIRNDPHKLVLGDIPNESQELGHLHIDILPSHQRRGFGKQLITTFCSAVGKQGCKAVYLGMSATNHGAAKFYEAYGFKRLPNVLDDGSSGELGRTGKKDDAGQALYYVIDL